MCISKVLANARSITGDLRPCDRLKDRMDRMRFLATKRSAFNDIRCEISYT